MLPFAVASLPTDVKAYSIGAFEDGSDSKLYLEEVTSLAANIPYVIGGAWEVESLTGDAQGIAVAYTTGWLTGTYVQMDAPDKSYILQKPADKAAGFFEVDYKYLDENEMDYPNVNSNRAYLTVPAEENPQGVKSFILGDFADAIQSVMSGVAAGEIYDLGGRKVSKMQKGNVYIVNGKKVAVK